MTTLVKFLFRSPWAPLEEVLKVDAKDFIAIRSPADGNELHMMLSEGTPTLVLASIQSKEDITAVLVFLKAQKKLLQGGTIKFAAVNFTNNRQVETALMKAGCQEALDPLMKGKQLKFKLDFWKKALAGAGPKGGGDFKMKDMATGGKADVRPDGIQWGDPLKHVDDMWLIKPTDAKRIMGKWLVKFMGPSPMVAQWADVPGLKGVWKFAFKEGARDEFHAAEGNWLYQGEQRPEFVWKENVWMITGKQGRLFYREEAEETVRFSATASNLDISKNSTYGQSREKAIIDSFDQELLVKKGLLSPGEAAAFEKERTSYDPLKGKTEGEEALGGDPLSGKGSTDNLGGGPLSGNASTDKLQGGPLKGAFGADHPAEGRMEGQGLVAPARAGAELSMATDPVAKGGGPMSAPAGQNPAGALAGKTAGAGGVDAAGQPLTAPVSQAIDGALSGKIGTDDLGPAKNKGRMEFGKEEGLAEYGGKSSTDNLGKGHYDGHTEHQSGAPRPDAEHGNLTDDLGKGHYGGRTEGTPGQPRPAVPRHEGSTDDLGKGHYDGRTEGTPGQPRPAAPRHEGSTDDLGKSHYAAPAPGAGPTGEMGGGWDNPDIIHKPLVEKRGADGAHERKMNQMDELLPAGGAEDPRADLGPEEHEALSPMSGVVIPIMRGKQAASDAAGEAALTAEAAITAIIRRRGDKGLGVTAKVEDFFDGDLIARVAATAFKKGDEVEIAMSFDYMKISKKMEFGGQCTFTEDAGDGQIYLTVKLSEQHVKLFEQFLQLYQMRQKNVSEFIKQVKGF